MSVARFNKIKAVVVVVVAGLLLTGEVRALPFNATTFISHLSLLLFSILHRFMNVRDDLSGQHFCGPAHRPGKSLHRLLLDRLS